MRTRRPRSSPLRMLLVPYTCLRAGGLFGCDLTARGLISTAQSDILPGVRHTRREPPRPKGGTMATSAPGLPVYDYTVLKSVRAVCPQCFAADLAFDPQYPDDVLDGHLVTRDGKVYLRRWCRRGHGE